MASPHRRALIIEDEMIIALELEFLLSELGFEAFDVAESPAEAVACARAHRPDLITADYRIIGGTGVEAVQAIEAELGPTPVVYVTGNTDVVKRETTAPIVDKPVRPSALAAACQVAYAHG